ncbi:MAG: RNA polymerase sigma factor [Elusimicrobiota bacterium]|jgi:RNA polymerase sigma-70 factor (ECF subfamily)|nr:RNA polymerase sigma factor [Elusimicrobiota bacterium]
MQDDIIIASIKNGKKEDFGLLVEKYKNQLYSFIYYSVKNDAIAGDLFQDTMLKALQEINKYQEEGKFKAWLFTIARNKITDYFRKSSKVVQFSEEMDADTFASPDNTATKALGNISLEEIGGFISKLPKEQQEVILLRQYLSFKEIAHALNCPIGTVLARMNRGIKKLQAFMGEEYAT